MRRVHVVLVFAMLLGLLLPAVSTGTGRFIEGGQLLVASSVGEPLDSLLPTAAVQAAGRGNPWINLRDGEAVPTTYAGPAGQVQALEGGQTQPLALVSDDFDEDGMPDLAAGYAQPDGGGLLALHRGSIDYLWPDGPEAAARRAAGLFVDAPFLPAASIFALPVAPDYLGAGDFDNDGHRDLAAAARGDTTLYLLPGDGRGGFGQAQGLPLPGRVTAFAAGEVNRRDGLQDLVVAVDGPAGPQLLVFEGPLGALRREPEAIDLPAPVTSLAIGQMDEHYAMDVAAACGETLVLVHGRDRRLSVSAAARAAVPPAAVEALGLPYELTALALGDFIPEQGYEKELALLATDGVVRLLDPRTAQQLAQLSLPQSANLNAEFRIPNFQLVLTNVSSLPGDDLAVLDVANKQLYLVVAVERGATRDENGAWDTVVHPWSIALDTAGAPAALLPMRLNPDALSDLVILQDRFGGPVVAATAPMSAFVVDSTGDDPDDDVGDGQCATADGVCTLRAVLEELQASPGANEISFNIGAGTPSIYPQKWLPSVPESTTILGNTGGAERVEISGSQMGWYDEILQLGGGNSTVRGLVLNHKYQGNGISMRYFDGNIVEGCYIGTDKTGSIAVGNRRGVYIFDTSNHTIGGTAPGAGNLISANESSGIEANGAEIRIQGNLIGTDASGSLPLGNSGSGVSLSGANPTVGGTEAGARNVIAANGGMGVSLYGDGALLQGNYIGTDASGTVGMGNCKGSNEWGAVNAGSYTTIGGTAKGAGNLISDNSGLHSAIVVIDIVRECVIQGNKIGTDVSGSQPLGNGPRGVYLVACSGSGCDHVVGGDVEGAGNIIAYNGGEGIYIDAFSYNDCHNNLISHNSMFGNGRLGIDLPPVGPNPNDPGDGDGGSNKRQNYPTLITTTMSGNQVTIEGLLNSTPNASFQLEFFASNACDPSGYGEGQFFLGGTAVTTDLEGNAPFVVTFPARGKSLSATAIDAEGNTSEFSPCTLLPRYKTAEPDRVTFVRPITYTLGVKNTAAASVAVNVQDPLPAGTRFVQGSLWASQGTPAYDGSRVTWEGTLDPGVELQVRFAVSTTCEAPALILNQASVTQDGETYLLEAVTGRYEPEYLDIAAQTPSPAANARDVVIDPQPALSWSGTGTCGTDPDAGHQVAYRVYLQAAGQPWQEVGSYPNCGRSIPLPANALQCGQDGNPAAYAWKVEAVDLQNPCRDEVVQQWNFETASCRPSIEVEAKYGQYFLSNVGLENPYQATVDWNGPARQGHGEALAHEIHFELNGEDVIEPGQNWGAEHSYNMGQDFQASLSGGDNVLRIWAVNDEGYESEQSTLQPMVFPLPAWITQFTLGDFEVDLQALTVKYSREISYPNPHFEARTQVPGWVPYLGGARMGVLESYAAVEVEACSDGSGAVELSGNTGVQLGEGAAVLGRLFGRGYVHLGSPEGLDLTGASFGLQIAGKIAQEMGIADLIPGLKAAESWPLVGWIVKWFNQRATVEGSLEPGIDIEARFQDVDDELVFEEATGTGEVKLTLTLTLRILKGLQAAVYGGGTPKVIVQVPAAEPWGYLKEISIRLFAGVRITIWIFEGEWERGVTCSLPTAGCKSDQGEEGAPAPSWRLLRRGYRQGQPYALFVANDSRFTPHVSATTAESPIVSNVFPLSQPALAQRADGARMLLWVHDDVAQPIAQSTEIHAAYYDGSSWSHSALTGDSYGDFGPQVAFDGGGSAVALWERTDTVHVSPTLSITYARSLKVASAVYEPGAGTWSSPVILSRWGMMGSSPRLAQGQDGSVMALWQTSDGGDLLGSAGHPLTLTCALWDGSAWSTPTAALEGLSYVLDADLAVYSATQAALVLAGDSDGDPLTSSDGELYYATWDGTAWSSLLPLTSDAISDTAPALAYDAAGQPVVVWLRGNDLVVQAGWGGTPSPVRPGSTAGTFLDFALSASPEGHLALLWQALSPSGADLAYSVYDATHGSWGADNVLMQDQPTEEAFAAAFAADGTLLAAYNKVTVELVTMTYDISPTLTITVTDVPRPVQTDLYLLEHSLGYDLALGSTDLALSSPNPAPGSSVTISATVHNRGDLAVSGGEVAFYDGDPAAGGALIGTVQPLPEPFRAATTATVSVAWDVPAGASPHVLYVLADPADGVPEFDEGNNQATLAAVLPDLAVVWAQSSYTTKTVTLQAAVENVGVVPASAPFSLAFRAANPFSGTLLGSIALTDTLAAGQQFSLSLVLTDAVALAGLGDSFWAIADGEQALLEADEGNNVDYGALGARPDLALSALDIAGEGPVWVTVHNSGPLTASAVVLAVWSDGLSGTLVYSGSLGALGPGESATAQLYLPLGKIELWAKADPGNAIAEGDESNNLAVRWRAVLTHVYLPLVLGRYE